MLKYLFIATFADGYVQRQTPADVSPVDPKKSEFFDTLAHHESSPLIRFELVGLENEASSFNASFAVDLKDGHFEVNGHPFWLHDEDFIDFKLIFWRRHRHHIEVSANENKESGHEVAYQIGWETNVGGKEFKRVMTID